ncbi:MAG: hypothetical protein WC773_03505 [Patescibacteria group bacterium]|jgi:pimeloyl-ACP methyl ester carboxylesterase
MKLSWVCLIGVLFTAPTLSGCGGGGGGTPAPPASNKFSVTKDMTPSGGTIDVGATGVSVSVPSGVLNANGTVTATVYKGASIPSKPPSAPNPILAFEAKTATTVNDGVATVSMPSTHPANTVLVGAYRLSDGTTWKWADVTESGGKATIAMPVSSSSRGVAQFIIYGVLLAFSDQKETVCQISLLAGTGDAHVFPSTGRVALLVHGMWTDASKLKSTAQALVSQGGFKAVYAFEYPWAIDITLNAQELNRLLKLQPKEQRVVMIAHSMGGLVSRYALEQDTDLSDRASNHVQELVMLATPNAGSLQADVILTALRDDAVMNPESADCQWSSLKSIALSITQMLTWSTFIHDLDYPTNHLNSVSYYTVGGTNDQFVTVGSAAHLPDGATLGPRDTSRRWGCGHTDFWSVSLSNKLIDLLIATKLNNGPSITVIGTNYGKPTDSGWNYYVDLLGGQTVGAPYHVNEIIFKTSNRSGTEYWRQWYATNFFGGYFPDTRTLVDITVPRDGEYALPLIGCTFDKYWNSYGNTSYDSHAKTIDLWVNGTDSANRPFSSHKRFQLLDKDGSGPSTPRSVNLGAKLVPGGTMTLAPVKR